MTGIDRDRVQEALEYADRWVSYKQQLHEIPGVTVAFRQRDELLLSRAYGHADLEQQVPMTTGHIFRIASHSKTFTATAVMILVERGAMRLDDPAGTFVDRLPDWAARLTIRQLLNHSSGIIRDGEDADFWQLFHPFPDEDDLLELTAHGGEILPANDRFKYSNIGFSLAGLAVLGASHVPYNEFVKREIVDRLGLPDTGPETDDHARSRLVTGYSRPFLDFKREPIPDVPTGAMSAATGFYSTAEDLSRYASAHILGNEVLLSDASKREMQQPYWATDDAGTEHYGLGFAVMKIGERKIVGHGGSFPGHATRTLFDPEDGLVVSVLTNQSNGPSKVLAEGIMRLVDYALKQDAPAPEAGLDRFTGRLITSWGAGEIAAFGDSLLMLSPDADDPLEEKTELEVIDEDTLRIAKTNGYESPGQTVRFFRDEQGRTVKVNDAGLTVYPEDIYREHLRNGTLGQ